MNKEEREMLREAYVEAQRDARRDSQKQIPPHIPIFNKYVIPILSFLLLFLLVSYFVFGPVEHTIRGQIASSAVENNEFIFGEYLILFYNNTASELESIYTANQEEKLVETSVCLKGLVYNKTYAVQEIFYPKIYSATFKSVSFAPCPKDTIVMLHTHPYKSCLASDQDKITYEENKKRSPNMLMLVMCEQRRYTLYD